ncbi:MAG: hypothetical protein ABIO04_01555 [Ferruginibacter sp.]
MSCCSIAKMGLEELINEEIDLLSNDVHPEKVMDKMGNAANDLS